MSLSFSYSCMKESAVPITALNFIPPPLGDGGTSGEDAGPTIDAYRRSVSSKQSKDKN
jgi:hypothetical protein